MSIGEQIAAFVAHAQQAHEGGRVTLSRDYGGSTASVAVASLASEEAEDVAGRFLSRVEAFTEAAPPDERQRFLMIAWDDDGEVIEQMPLGGVDRSDAVARLSRDETEPTPSGAIRATMKHLQHERAATRKLLQDLVRSLRQEVHSKAKRIETLEERNDKMSARQWELAEAIEDSKSQAHARKIAEAKEEAEIAGRVFLFTRFSELADVAVSHLAGAPAMTEWVRSLDAEKLRAVAKDWPPDQIAKMEKMLALGERGETSRLSMAGVRPDAPAQPAQPAPEQDGAPA